jgi:NAD-dependent dihydropyrimidine dehydrogenase PreA subunit
MPPVINMEKCKSCGLCDLYCPGDIIHTEKSPDDRKIPVVAYPDECFHCGICRLECTEDAVTYVFPPLMQ